MSNQGGKYYPPSEILGCPPPLLPTSIVYDVCTISNTHFVTNLIENASTALVNSNVFVSSVVLTGYDSAVVLGAQTSASLSCKITVSISK